MENIFLESYDIFKIYPHNSGKIYNEFLKNNKKYSITRCYYSITIDNIFLTYSHLMIYEMCLYLLFSQNKLEKDNFCLTIKKTDLSKKFKTNITKSAVETIKRFYELKDVKITIFVKDQIKDQMNIIQSISTPEPKKYKDIPEEIKICLNQTFVNLYQCAYIDKIEYLNSFSTEQGSFIRYFIQQDLGSGIKTSAILDKMGVMNYVPLSRKKIFKDEILNLNFHYKNEQYFVENGFVVSENSQNNVFQNQNAFISLFGIIKQEVAKNLQKNIILNNENLSSYYKRFGKFESPDIFFNTLNNMEIFLNKSLQQNNAEISYFSHFFEDVVFVNTNNFKINLQLTQKGFEYILSKKSNLDLWDIESQDYGLTSYPIKKACDI